MITTAAFKPPPNIGKMIQNRNINLRIRTMLLNSVTIYNFSYRYNEFHPTCSEMSKLSSIMNSFPRLMIKSATNKLSKS